MHFQRRYFLLTAAVVFLLCKICSASLLGIASDYSAFTFGPIELERSDAGGGIAGAGNITLDSYSTGRGRESSQYTVISDGSVTCVNGIVYNGGLFAGNNTELPPALPLVNSENPIKFCLPNRKSGKGKTRILSGFT